MNILSKITSRLDLIDICPRLLIMKLEAIRQIALSKVQHLFSNVHIQQNARSEINNTVSLVQKWFGLNRPCTGDINFSPPVGRLRVLNIIWIYTNTPISNLLNILNNSDRC